MEAIAKIILLHRENQTQKSSSRYVSKEAIRGQGRFEIIEIISNKENYPVSEGMVAPFEMQNRIVPAAIKKNRNRYVQIRGSVEDLTKKKKIKNTMKMNFLRSLYLPKQNCTIMFTVKGSFTVLKVSIYI